MRDVTILFEHFSKFFSGSTASPLLPLGTLIPPGPESSTSALWVYN